MSSSLSVFGVDVGRFAGPEGQRFVVIYADAYERGQGIRLTPGQAERVGLEIIRAAGVWKGE